MYRKKNIFLLAGLILFSASCGFEPLYVEKKSTSDWYYDSDFDSSIMEEMAQIKIDPIPGRIGQLIRNELLDNLTPKGVPAAPKYVLRIDKIDKQEIKQALRNDITATRERVQYTVYYSLLDAQTRKVIISSNSLSYLGYNIMANPYSTTFSEKKNQKDAAKILANDITLRMGAYFHSVLTKRGDPNEL